MQYYKSNKKLILSKIQILLNKRLKNKRKKFKKNKQKKLFKNKLKNKYQRIYKINNNPINQSIIE